MTATDDLIEVRYRECRGTLSEREEQWHRYESIESLPETPLDGWEELVVYTDEPVYAGDTLTGETEVTDLSRDERGRGHVDFTVEIQNQEGAIVMSDTTLGMVRCRDE